MFIDSDKDTGRATVKGDRASPSARPQLQLQEAPATETPPIAAEALAVLIQHLVFNLDAFQTPSLKRRLEKSRRLVEEMRETLVKTRLDHAAVLKEECARRQKEIEELSKQHQLELAQINQQHCEAKERLITEYETTKLELSLNHNEQLMKLRAECTKLQKTHEQTLEILREENDSIREEIDDKNAIIDKLGGYKKQKEKLEKDFKMRELRYKERMTGLAEEVEHHKDENVRIKNYISEGKENKLKMVLAEVESLRAVLELKQREISDLRRALIEANQKSERLPSIVEKVSFLTARCEDLQSQIDKKSVCEHQLLADNKKLQESFKEECNHSRRLQQHNEELQWRLRQNKEVVSLVLGHTEESAFKRSLRSSSFNEYHLERTTSFKEHSFSNKSVSSTESSNKSRKSKNSYDLDSDDVSPASSPKIKAIVEKSDSVSYVLEMEESPEVVASRIVRRSFRNSTPSKTTPTKSPVNKKPRMKNSALTLSASASAITPVTITGNHSRSRSVSIGNNDVDDDDTRSNNVDEVFMWHSATSTPFVNKGFSQENSCNDSSFYSAEDTCKYENNIDLDEKYSSDIKLPPLPSEIGRQNDAESLPVPKHLAGEAMISDSNSEDESITSSSSGQL